MIGSSPSITSTFVPPPRKRCGMPSFFKIRIASGIASYRRSKISSVVPPMPSDVRSASATPWRTSTPSALSFSAVSALIRISRNLRFQQHPQLFRDAPHASRADGQYRISGPRLAQNELHRRLHRAAKDYVLVAGRAHRFGQLLAGDSLNVLFAGGINFRQHQNVRFIERTAKIVPQCLRACVTMRLEYDDQTLISAPARSFECRANLGRMMAVIVNYGNSVKHTANFKAPPDPAELSQTCPDQVRRHVKRQRHSRRGCRVADVVNSWRGRQTENPQIIAAICKAKLTRQPLQPHVRNHKIGLHRSAVCDHRPLDARNNRLHVGLVNAKNRAAVKRNSIRKLQKDLLNFFERAVLIEVLAIDRCNHRDHRREQKERAIALVSFDDYKF